MLITLILITALLFAAIAWKNLRLGIFLILAALPTYLIRFHLGPIPTTLLELLLLITIGVWLLRVFTSERADRFIPRKDNFLLPIILVLLAGTIGVTVSPDPLAALGVWKAYIIEPILFFFVVRTTLTKKDIEPALHALGIAALCVSVLALLQWITGLGIPAPWDLERRVTSVFDFPNAVGLFLGPIVSIAIVKIASPPFKGGVRGGCIFWLVVAGLGTLAIITAQTEAAYVAIVASLLIVSFLYKRLRKVTIPLAIILCVAAMLITPIREKLLLQDYSGQVRQSQWSETVKMLKDHPVFGAGLAGYPIVFEPYHHTEWVEVFQYPHNVVLNIWSELGLLGLLAFVLIFWRSHTLVKTSMRSPQGLEVIAAAVLAALVEMMIHGLVDVPYFKNDLALMTIGLLALLVLSTTLDQPTQK